MIKLISSRAACILCKNEESDEMQELYEYAIYIFLSGLFHLVSVVALGSCFNMILESLAFYGSFVLIRKFAGGYHAKTPTRCYLFSVISSMVVLLLIKLMCTLNDGCYYVFLSIVFCCVVFIIIVAPLDNENKPLNIKEKKVYKILSFLSSILMFALTLIVKCVGLDDLSISVSFGIIMCAVVVFLRCLQILHYRQKLTNT